MLAPPVPNSWDVRYPLKYDVSGMLPCCVDWLKYLSCRPEQTVATAADLDNYIKHVEGHEKTHAGNGKHCGAWAFTLTSSPKDGYSVNDLMTAARKIMSQKSCEVIKYAWYLEYKGYDADGTPIHPHIHGMYETRRGGRIEKKHWMRAWKIWKEDERLGAGFRGGYHRPVKSDEAYNDYIKKDGGISESNGLE